MVWLNVIHIYILLVLTSRSRSNCCCRVSGPCCCWTCCWCCCCSLRKVSGLKSPPPKSSTSPGFSCCCGPKTAGPRRALWGLLRDRPKPLFWVARPPPFCCLKLKAPPGWVKAAPWLLWGEGKDPNPLFWFGVWKEPWKEPPPPVWTRLIGPPKSPFWFWGKAPLNPGFCCWFKGLNPPLMLGWLNPGFWVEPKPPLCGWLNEVPKPPFWGRFFPPLFCCRKLNPCWFPNWACWFPNWDCWIPNWDGWFPNWDCWFPNWDCWFPNCLCCWVLGFGVRKSLLPKASRLKLFVLRGAWAASSSLASTGNLSGNSGAPSNSSTSTIFSGTAGTASCTWPGAAAGREPPKGAPDGVFNDNIEDEWPEKWNKHAGNENRDWMQKWV